MKIGCASAKPIDQMPALLRASELNAALSPPISPVSEIRGRSAALATPICALAAIRFCSAWRISGRRSSKVDGKPVGGSGGTGSWARSPGGSFKIEPAGKRPEQVFGQRALAHELVELRRRIRARAGRLREIEVRGEAAVDAAAHDAEILVAGRQRFARRGDLRVERAQQEIGLAWSAPPATA